VLRRYYQTILGVLLTAISLFFMIAIVGYNNSDYSALIKAYPVNHIAGPIGAWTGHILRSLFGIAAILMILPLIIPSCFLIRASWINRVTEKTIVSILLMVSVSALVSLFLTGTPQDSGGMVGVLIASQCYTICGSTISYILFFSISMLSLIILIILFLSPEHDHIEKTAVSFNRLRRLCSRIPFMSRKEDVPLINFRGKLDQKSSRFPWIIKKRIVVYQTEATDTPYDFLTRPQLPEGSINCDIGLLPDTRTSEAIIDDTEIDEEIIDTEHEVVLHEDEYRIDNTRETIISDDQTFSHDEDPHEKCASGDKGASEESGCAVSDQEYLEKEYQEENEDQETGYLPDTEPVSAVTGHVFDEIPINEEYIIPTSYLTSSKPLDTENWKNEIKKNSVLLKNTLAEFGIESDVVNVNRGPVITLYEMQIAPGIKVNRIVGLADDIAMALAAQRVRIVAPIPGKSAIGVEIPNRYRETVTLGDIIKSDEYQNYNGSLSVALGKDILGNPVMLDLKRLPHLLIAGTTGSGKSVCVNSIIMSLLYNYEPNYLRFIMIDPKMVELQFYNGLPHLLTPVIVDPQVAPMVLKWTMHEMERRYFLLAEQNTRDIERYNEKIEKKRNGVEKLPYIVAIIDEMADLMMSSKEVEGYITRIAQKSRAVGIHLVVATQRPSVDIITGLIKANFPARIAFQVAQKTDSRTIIDQNGAEKLLGRGDMLYQSPISSFPMRIQGGFISEDEIERIVNHLCRMGKPSYIDIEENLLDEEESRELDNAGDELFHEALKIVEETKKASASYLQRRLSIGYNRAARIIEQMEDMGYIGPQIGSKPREVFI
jgi:DNA segregation ATPase FtsK/SpoIIIE-like protein